VPRRLDSGTRDLGAASAGGLAKRRTDLGAGLVSQHLHQQRTAVIVGQARNCRLDGIEFLLRDNLTLNGIRGRIRSMLLLAQELLIRGDGRPVLVVVDQDMTGDSEQPEAP
jgi:hypothetical protein